MAFLTKDLVVLSHARPDGDGLVEFDVWSLKAGRLLYRCKLPLLAAEYLPRFLTHPASNHSGRSPTKHAKIFIPDPAVEILGIIFKSIPAEPAIPSESVTVALSIHLFVQKCQELATDHITEDLKYDAAPVFDWEQWGPPTTRWLPNSVHGEVGGRSTFGSRMLAALVAPVEGGNGAHRIHTMMLDFNPRPIARGTQEADTDDYIVRFLDRESTLEVGGISIVSALPCRMWISSLWYGYLSLFLDGNTIVGRLVSAFAYYGTFI